MLSGDFNYHKIMFSIEMLQSKDEKIQYINYMLSKIRATIQSFEEEKPLNLRMYADDTMHIEDNCPELQQFVKSMIQKYSPQIPDRRVPSNEQLKALVKEEAKEYRKLEQIITFYLHSIERENEISHIEDEIKIVETAIDSFHSKETNDELEIEKNFERSEDSEVKDEQHISGESLIDQLTKGENKKKNESKINAEEKKPLKRIIVNPNKKDDNIQDNDNIIRDH